MLINISEHIGHLVDGSSVKPEVRSLRLVFLFESIDKFFVV